MAHTYTNRQLVQDFDLVAEHYGLKELGEYDEARQAARNDIESAKICFAAMAAKIRQSNLEVV